MILETFGTGNAPTDQWFLDMLREAIRKKIILYNVTQCKAGGVEAGRYLTGRSLVDIGVVSGMDITTEGALAKLMHLMGRYDHHEKVKEILPVSIRGEITPG